MTINTNDVRNEYTASAAQTIFNYTFKIYDTTDLNVYVTPAGQDCVPGDLTTAYSVTGVGLESGGAITLSTGTANLDLVTIVSSIPDNRTTDYQNNGDFRPSTVNDDIDRVVSLVKQSSDKVNRTVSFEECEQGVASKTLPAPVAGAFWRMKQDLTGMENHTFSSSGIVAEVSVSNYASLRSLTSTGYSDGQVILVTNDGLAGMFTVKTGAVTDNDGTLIVFTDDSNRYAERPIEGPVYASWFNVLADGSTDDITALVAVDAYALSIGGAVIWLPEGTINITVEFTLSAGNTLRGSSRGGTVIDQQTATENGIAISGGCTIEYISIQAPIAGTSQTTIGLNADGTSDIIVRQVRILYFGVGVSSINLTWRQTYEHVRVELPRAYGFYFNETAQHLEIYLMQCYVVNNSTLGATNKTSFYIEGSKGTYLNNCTSDGGNAVGTKNMGANFINSNIVMTVSHWEAYSIPAGMIAGTEYDSLIRVKGGDLIIDNLHIQVAIPTTASVGALIYGEDSARITYDGVVVDSSTITAYSSQQIALSNTFGNNSCNCLGGQRELILAQAGTRSGEAQFFRKGKIARQTITIATVIDVNTTDSLIISGTAGTITNFTGGHTTNQKVFIYFVGSGVTMVHSGGFRFAGAANFVAAAANIIEMTYVGESGGFWTETNRYV